MNAAVNANDVLAASTNYVNESPKHKRKDSINDFARGKVLLRIGNNDYTADVIVAHTKGGQLKLYDIVEMKKAEHSLRQYSAGAADTNSSPAVDDGGRLTAPFANNMPQGVSVVNGENNLQHSVSTISFNDLFGGSSIGNTMQDAQYAAAVKKGDMEAAQKFVDDQANRSLSKSKAPRDASGRLVKFFTGTDNGPYTVPDPLLADDGISLFGTTERQTAGTYTHNPSGNPIYDKQGVFSQYFDMRNPLVIDNEQGSSWHDMTQGKENYVDVRIHAYNDGAYRIEAEGSNGEGLQDVEFSDYDEMMEWLEEKYDRIVSVDAAAVIDFMEGDLPDESDPFAEPDFYEGFDENGEYTGEIPPESIHLEYLIDERGDDRIYLGGINHEEAAGETAYDSDAAEKSSAKANTRNYARWAFVHGRDSVLFTNIVDTNGFLDTDADARRGVEAFLAAVDRGGDTIAVVFSPNQIKSADPATYDDNGKLIDLSRRFNENEKDIRYSIDTGSIEDMMAEVVGEAMNQDSALGGAAQNVPAQNGTGIADTSLQQSIDVARRFGRAAYKSIVSGAAGTERVARVQSKIRQGAVNADDLAQGVRVSPRISQFIMNDAAIDIDGNEIGKSFKAVFSDVPEEL